MKEIKAPEITDISQEITIFLAGSIEMGTAENWQERIAKELSDWNVTLLNPRRDDWDSSWVQEIENQQFNEQVTWELSHIEKADIVVVYFDPNTKSPVTLSELGICSVLKPEDLLVCCPKGFWRRGNVQIICDRYNIRFANDIEEFISMLKSMLYFKYPETIV